MSRIAHINSLPFRLALFFAVNPDEVLDTADIAIKYDLAQTDVHQRLKHGVRSGLFNRQSSGPGRGKRAQYTAGDMLMLWVGGATQRAMIEACAPIALAIARPVQLRTAMLVLEDDVVFAITRQ